ncbi:MAG: hypothetical protein NUV97_00720 [archaeon]|nr:hypothetical protein [archaeon]MCR4323352.1 hypothetical protein [Nanoarchaeota archaeon]
MMGKVLTPTKDEIRRWLVSTLQHSCHVEYFLGKLGLGNKDPERPHDLVGLWNKYDWEIVKGLALQYRKPRPDFETYILPALKLHRQQYHHRMWNEPDPNDKTRPVQEASEEDMLLGAVDAVCSLLECRDYQGGAHNYKEIEEIARKNPPHQTSWMLEVLPEMELLRQPNLEQITSLGDFPNIGIRRDLHDHFVIRTREAVETLKEKQGILIR